MSNLKPTNTNNSTRNLVLISAVFAAIMLGAAYLLPETVYARNTTMLILIALWFMPFAYFASHRNQ